MAPIHGSHPWGDHVCQAVSLGSGFSPSLQCRSLGISTFGDIILPQELLKNHCQQHENNDVMTTNAKTTTQQTTTTTMCLEMFQNDLVATGFLGMMNGPTLSKGQHSNNTLFSLHCGLQTMLFSLFGSQFLTIEQLCDKCTLVCLCGSHREIVCVKQCHWEVVMQ